MKTNNFFGININNGDFSEILDALFSFTKSGNRGYVVTPNIDHIVKLQKNKEFMDAYSNASLILADGMPLVWASRLLGKPLKRKISGADLFPELLSVSQEQNLSVFFLGASDQTSKKAVARIKKDYPGLQIAGRYSPPFGFEKNERQTNRIVNMINMSNPNFLFLFFGAPKQELWIHEHIESLDINLAFCLGASLDFIAADIKRAPLWMQKSGLEWFWRMCADRRLIKRYLVDDMFPFIYLFLKEFWKVRVQSSNKATTIGK